MRETSETYLQKASDYLMSEKWEEAIAAYQRALELNPNLPGIHQKIGDAFHKQATSERSHLLNIYQQKIQTLF